MDDEENDLDNIFEEYETGDAPNEENEGENNTNGNDPGTDAQTKERVAPPRRAVKNPRLKFNAERLCGERGIPVVVNHFKDVKFKGKGHEKEDLDKLLSTLEHWCHRLYPSMKFGDCLRQVEKLGKKRPVQTCLRKIRLDMPILSGDFIHEDRDDEREADDEMDNELDMELPPQDAFDRLLSGTPSGSSNAPLVSTPLPVKTAFSEQRLGTLGSTLTEEQRKRMEYNKLLATERRKAKLAAMQSSSTSQSEELFGSESTSVIGNNQTDNLINGQTDIDKPSASERSPLSKDIFTNDQFDSLINESVDVSEASTTGNANQTSFKALVKNSFENLELDDLVDLVDDDDEDETIPLHGNNASSHHKPNQHHRNGTEIVDLTTNQNNELVDLEDATTVIHRPQNAEVVHLDDEPDRSNTHLVKEVIDLENETTIVRSRRNGEVVDLDGEPECSTTSNKFHEVVDLENETTMVLDRRNIEVVQLDNELELEGETNDLSADEGEIIGVENNYSSKKVSGEDDVQSMEVD